MRNKLGIILIENILFLFSLSNIALWIYPDSALDNVKVDRLCQNILTYFQTHINDEWFISMKDIGIILPRDVCPLARLFVLACTYYIHILLVMDQLPGFSNLDRLQLKKSANMAKMGRNDLFYLPLTHQYVTALAKPKSQILGTQNPTLIHTMLRMNMVGQRHNSRKNCQRRT